MNFIFLSHFNVVILGAAFTTLVKIQGKLGVFLELISAEATI